MSPISKSPFLMPGTLFVYQPTSAYANTYGSQFSKIDVAKIKTKKGGNESGFHYLESDVMSKYSKRMHPGDTCILIKTFSFEEPDDCVLFLVNDELLGTNKYFWEENFKLLLSLNPSSVEKKTKQNDEL